MMSADVTSHQHSALGIVHLSLFSIIVNNFTWAEFSSHEACINQDFPDHLTLQLSTPIMIVASELRDDDQPIFVLKLMSVVDHNIDIHFISI